MKLQNDVKYRKYYIIFVLLTQALLLFIFVKNNLLWFETNDDCVMANIASGGYAYPSEYIINMHILLGYLLKLLFLINNKINWLTILYIFFISLSFVFLDIFFIYRNNGNSIMIKILVIDLFYLYIYQHFTFTVIAYLLYSVGILYILNRRDKTDTIIGFILSLFGSLVRYECIYSLIFVSISYILFMIITKKYTEVKKIILSIFIILFFSVISNYSNLYIEGKNSIQKNFRNWGETRSKALDCAKVEYNDVKFKKYNIEKTKYEAVYNAFYYSYEAVDSNVLEGIIELNDFSNKYNFNFIDIIKSILSNFKNCLFSFSESYRFILIVCVLINLLSNKNNETIVFCLLIVMFSLGSEAIFYIIQRPKYRVIMPNYMFSSLLLLNKIDLKNANIIKKTLSYLIIFFLMIIPIKFVNSSKVQRIRYNDFIPIIDYLDKNNEKLYLAIDANVFNIPVFDSVWNTSGSKNGWNLTGNWETYSVPYFNLTNSHNIKDPYNLLFESINNNNVLYLSSSISLYNTNERWIIELVKQLYNIDVKFVKLYDITNFEGYSYSVYKLCTI